MAARYFLRFRAVALTLRVLEVSRCRAHASRGLAFAPSIFPMAAPYRACIRSAHPEKTRLRRARPAKAGALRSSQVFSGKHSLGKAVALWLSPLCRWIGSEDTNGLRLCAKFVKRVGYWRRIGAADQIQ